MKKLWIFLLFVSLQFSAKSQPFDNAIQYNDYIVGQQNLIGEKIIAFNNEFGVENVTREMIQPYYDSLLSTARQVVVRMRNLEAFDGNEQFLKASVDLMEFYQRTVEGAYLEMINIVFDPDLNDQSVEKLNTLLNNVTSEEAKYDDIFQQSQEAFAGKYGFTLEKNALEEELKGSE
jgi:hypothetical protein